MKKQGNRGVTLMVVIITVIILLTLTGVVIYINKNIIAKAKQTTNIVDSQTEQDKELEEEIKNTWDNLPGQPVKSPTAPE